MERSGSGKGPNFFSRPKTPGLQRRMVKVEVITKESVEQLAREVKDRGRARLLAELSTQR